MSAYTVYVRPRALHEIKNLPGHIRQRVKRAIDLLAKNPQWMNLQALYDLETAKDELEERVIREVMPYQNTQRFTALPQPA